MWRDCGLRFAAPGRTFFFDALEKVTTDRSSPKLLAPANRWLGEGARNIFAPG